jgi:predicted methyltransferase
MWRCCVLGVVVLAAAPTAFAQNPPAREASGAGVTAAEPPGTYMGRTIASPMSASGAEWLTRESRDAEENSAKLLQSLELTPGQCVCDFGCGNGFYTLPMAQAVGPRGAVYAVDIQREMLELLDKRASPMGLKNLTPVLATEDDPGLPPAKFDLVLMVDVYHEIADPAAVLATVRASLKSTGRLAVVEFRAEDPDVPIRPLHKMSQAQVLREIPPNGFKLVGQFDELPWQHVLFFARDDSPRKKQPLQPWNAQD